MPKVVVNPETGEGALSRAATYPTAQTIRRWRRRRLDNPMVDVPNTEVVWEDAQGRMYGPTSADESTWYAYTPGKPRAADERSLPLPELDTPIRLIRAYDLALSSAIVHGAAMGKTRTLTLRSMTGATNGKLRYRTYEYNAEATGVRKFKGRARM